MEQPDEDNVHAPPQQPHPAEDPQAGAGAPGPHVGAAEVPGAGDNLHEIPQPQPNINPAAPPFWPPMWHQPPPWWHQQPPPWWQPHVPQQVHHEPRPDRVKLGEFFDERPAVWFNLLEASCRRNFILQPQDRYDVAVAALPRSVVKRLTMVEHPERYDDPYQVLRAEVIRLYSPGKWQNLDLLLSYSGSDGIRPTAMMAEMVALYPAEEEPNSSFFKAFFMKRLPADCKQLVQIQADDLDIHQLAELADKVWLGRSSRKPEIVAALPENDGPDDSAPVAALATNKKGAFPHNKNRKQQRPASKKGGQESSGTAGLCWVHRKHGTAAYHCAKPQECVMAAHTSPAPHQGN